MLDATQILIITAATIMTTLLVVIGIQLILILKDVRKVLTRVESFTGHIESLGGGLSSGLGEFVAFFAGATKLFQLVNTVSKKKKSKSAS
ncbi:MAG: hypothetical protein ACMG6E_02775 [Candidatus Roizmanbacteria bacterium]